MVLDRARLLSNKWGRGYLSMSLFFFVIDRSHCVLFTTHTPTPCHGNSDEDVCDRCVKL